MSFRITGPLPTKQRGGKLRVSGWLALLLLALAAGEAVVIDKLMEQNNHLHLQLLYHNMMTETPTRIGPDADAYVTHCFPQDESDCVCGSLGFVCYTSI